jgi:tryptophan-rich hypothetical protein
MQNRLDLLNPLKAMNPLHPKKLLLTKWTAVAPRNREKHFVVSRVAPPEEPGGPVPWVEIEAVHSGRSRRIAWRELRDSAVWRQGWV